MDTLHDNCQLLIIKYLDLSEQLNLFEAVIDEPTNRLNSNLRYYWQQQLKFCLIEDEFDKRPEVLHDFLFVISPKVQQLELWDVTPDRLQRMTHFNFPAMTSLRYILSDVYYNSENDEFDDKYYDCNEEKDIQLVIQLMGKLFPQLNSLYPEGPFDLVHLKIWKQLRKLNLTDSRVISRTNEFANIIQGLQQLEELRINCESLSKNEFNILVSLPKLQMLALREMSPRINCVIQMRAKEVEKITLDDVTPNKLCDIRQFIGLRQVTLHRSKDVTAENLQEFITALPQLRRLDIIDNFIFRSEIELWKTVASCPCLEILNISDITLDELFFSSNRQQMKTVLNNRSTSLTVHCHNTIGKELIRLHFEHPKLTVSFEPLEIDYIIDEVKFHFFAYTNSNTN